MLYTMFLNNYSVLERHGKAPVSQAHARIKASMLTIDLYNMHLQLSMYGLLTNMSNI